MRETIILKLVDQPVASVMEQMGHPSPELGGSSAAILAGLLGLSMVRMALSVSASHHEERARQALADVDGLALRLSVLADDDRTAFHVYLQAMKSDQRVESERHAAALATFNALFAAAEALVAALELSERMAEGIAKSVESDLFGGAALLDASFSGLAFAIETNLRPERMAAERQTLTQRLVSLDAKRKKAYGLITKRAGAAGFGS